MNAHYDLDERYFAWLCEFVGVSFPADPARSHILIAELMYKKPFNDSFGNDFNRALDGKDLRDQFLPSVAPLVPEDSWMSMECSMLEMFAALSLRLSFHTDWTVAASFQVLLTNLELVKYRDDRINDGILGGVQEILDVVNDRNYDSDGRGGLFPLSKPQVDQREVEIWYQMSAFLLENVTF